MEEKVIASLFTVIKTLKSLRNFYKANQSQNKKSANNFCMKRFLMLKHLFAEENIFSIILVNNLMKRVAMQAM
jgi:hypothetical protein